MRTMKRATALFDAEQGKVFNRVRDLLQMALREVQILSGGLQISVAEQKLDGAQVGSGFQQMRGPTPQRPPRRRLRSYRQTVSNVVFGPLRISGRRWPRVGDGLATIHPEPGVLTMASRSGC